MNVLIYVLDALRADHLSCYGYDRETTPAIDALATDGVRYDQCFSPATWTKPVGASLLTGAYPPTHGTRTREDLFDAEITRLPEILSDENFTTVGFSTMGNVSATLGYDRGFSEFADLYKDPDIIAKRRTKSTDTEELEQESASEIALPRAEDLTDRILRWLSPDMEPFFAFSWSIEPHIPYDPPEDFRDFLDSEYQGSVDGRRKSLPNVESDADINQLIGLYDGEIQYNDHEFGRIISRLKELDLYDDTLVVVLGDHGDAFNEHGQLTHGHLPYDELIHVPLIIKPPAEHDSPSVIDEIVSLVDILPTVATAVGQTEFPETVQGRPLPPYGPEGSSAPVYSETRSRDIYPAFYSVRTEKWKYMEVESPDRSPSTLIETAKQLYKRGLIGDILRNPMYFLRRYYQGQDKYLFDVESDPKERQNLIQEYPEKSREFEEKLSAWLAESERIHSSLNEVLGMEIDDQTNEQLKQLGYVD
ncbi:sulfatase [Natronomonas sp. EA1]|uniref:sulfatase n=1 Tax=Natronomonas sp. EA1 TaxID=3421655 RepID=UPI003EC04BD9